MRIALVAPILILILNDSFAWALGLFWLAGFSDGVDGYLAKRFNWHTRLGALLDPVADKLLVAGTFITLAYTQHIPIWLDCNRNIAGCHHCCRCYCVQFSR